MALTKEEIIINKQIDELRDRIKVIQMDSKASDEIWNASKSANMEEIKRLTEENKEYRKKVSLLEQSMIEESDEGEKRHLDEEVDNLRRTYDNLVIKSTRLRSILQELHDEYKAAELESAKPQLTDSDLIRKIRILENGLDTSLIKFNEAQGIKKTYEQIIYKLRDERVGFDNRLRLLERSLAAKQRDYDEILFLSNQAIHAKDIAYTELERIRTLHEENSKIREKELREKSQLVQLKKQMYERNLEREKLRSKLLETEKLEKSLVLFQALKDKTLLNEKVEKSNKLDIFADAFRRIREVTGVSNANEIIEKLAVQSQRTEQLIKSSKENQFKIEQLHQEYRKLKIKVEEMKYSQSGGDDLHRFQCEQMKHDLDESKRLFDKEQEKFEKLTIVLSVIKSGLSSIDNKLDSFRVQDGKQYMKFTINDDNLEDVIRQQEMIVQKLANPNLILNSVLPSSSTVVETKGTHLSQEITGKSNRATNRRKTISHSLSESNAQHASFRANVDSINTTNLRRQSSIYLSILNKNSENDNDMDCINDMDKIRTDVKQASSQIIARVEKNRKIQQRVKSSKSALPPSEPLQESNLDRN